MWTKRSEPRVEKDCQTRSTSAWCRNIEQIVYYLFQPSMRDDESLRGHGAHVFRYLSSPSPKPISLTRRQGLPQSGQLGGSNVTPNSTGAIRMQSRLPVIGFQPRD